MTLFESFRNEYKAGSPTDSKVYWISLTRSPIRRLFAEKHQIQLKSRSIRQMLGRLGYRYRSIQKELATGKCDEREEQFQFIFETVATQSLQTPILSIDCKKKELLGNLYREGKCDTIGHQKAYDHDFPNLGKGKIIPHGIYDLQHNQGFITIGNSSETSGFIVDNLRWWWSQFGLFQYPDAKHILILCDAGGGNSYRHHVFKKELQLFAREIGRDILICHYPPYASKWNPIEHRLFCHMHKAMSGQMFQDYETVQRLILNTQTDAGLTVKVRIHLQKYEMGIKTPQSDVNPKRIEFLKESSKLSYKICA